MNLISMSSNNNINSNAVIASSSAVESAMDFAVINTAKIKAVKAFFSQKKSIMAAPKDPLLAMNDKDAVMVRDVARVINTPIAYPVMSYFTMLSTLIGNSAVLRVGSSRNVNMTLWTCLVGYSGTGKSPVQNYFFAPIKSSDRSNWISAGIQSNSSSSKTVNYGRKAFPQVITGATKYHIEHVLDKNPHGITIAPDEISCLLTSWSASNRDFLLSGYDGAELTYGRGKNEIQHIPHGFISILGGIQPNRVRQVFREKDVASGFVQRMLMVDGIANQPRKVNPESSGFLKEGEERRDRVAEALSQLDFDLCGEPQKIYLTNDGYQLYCNWVNRLNVEHFIHRTTDAAGMFSKFTIVPFKIATMLKCADLADSVDFSDDELQIEVDENDMLRAIYITNWLLQSQKRVWEMYFKTAMLCKSLEEAVAIAVVENEEEIQGKDGHISSSRLAEMSDRFFEKKVTAASVGRAASALGFIAERGTEESPDARGWRISDFNIQNCKNILGIEEEVFEEVFDMDVEAGKGNDAHSES